MWDTWALTQDPSAIRLCGKVTVTEAGRVLFECGQLVGVGPVFFDHQGCRWTPGCGILLGSGIIAVDHNALAGVGLTPGTDVPGRRVQEQGHVLVA
jgi:hypothetical protein